jgi:F420H(2)-dependent quinone reductase
MDILELADRNWPILNKLFSGHTAIYRLTNGLIGHRLPGFPPMLLLDHVGARSGTRRTTPLAYLSDGDDLVLVASKGGYPKHPAWYHNLVANPDTTVLLRNEHRQVRATVATQTEHGRLWPLVVRSYSGFADYQKRTDRQIPLVVLKPR